jgi:hypothetical protein
METKKCNKCKEIKAIEEFSKDRQRKDGFSYYCKECQRTRGKVYYSNNAIKVCKRTKEYYKENKEYVNGRNKKYSREWYKQNIEYARQYAKEYYRSNIDKEKARCRRFFENNPDYRKQHNKKWKENNPDYEKQWCRSKRETDPAFRLSKNLSRQIRKSIHKSKDGYHWEDLLGYTLKDLMGHLEKLFKLGMTWQNMGLWHIDHIRPVSSFNFTSYEDKEFKECWSLNNLQPLWALENMKKGNKLIA